ncbi:MAG: tRNA (adenosine(37)-N6)-dimethylallyltransferase MiaA, partial [Lachnospiraceae bacterium]|nr:tRNA (adenosine(37)-N6)-dimethylallyltransferase MiaA [Lachnospiraceae bacterium]
MMNQTKQPLIILTGPTAAGKSALAVSLAREIGGEIISADSMQVYKHMDIGSAKITREEMTGVPHYLIDILEPDEEFHVVRFQSLAKEALKTIYEKGKIPILAGGTGFYIQSVLYDIDFTATEEDEAFRLLLEQFAREQGNDALFERLRQIDPKSCEILHANNVKRVIRAIEFYEKTGKPISEHNEEQHEKESPYQFLYFVLTDERSRLYEKIDKRVDAMLEAGLVDEVQSLKDMGCTRDLVSMQGLGYKEILEYLDGECSLEDAVYRIKRDTRHFAKRQL